MNSAIIAPTISASAITVDQSQTSSLTSTLISTGTSPYSYQWLEQVPGEESYVAVNDATSSSYSFATSTSTDIGTYSFELQVTDSASSAVISGAIAITVNAAPIVSLSPDSYSTNLGQSGTFTASASGGSGTYTSYQWYVGYDEVQSGISNSFTFSSSYAGSYSITVTVTDSLGLKFRFVFAHICHRKSSYGDGIFQFFELHNHCRKCSCSISHHHRNPRHNSPHGNSYLLLLHRWGRNVDTARSRNSDIRKWRNSQRHSFSRLRPYICSQFLRVRSHLQWRLKLQRYNSQNYSTLNRECRFPKSNNCQSLLDLGDGRYNRNFLGFGD